MTDLLAAFWDRVDRQGDCWQWTGHVAPSGYGQLGRCTYAHRFAYEMVHGPIPAGLHIDHLCRRRTCVNPAHLEAVTQAENNWRARRTHCPHGHAWDAENTRYYRNGRICRACHRESERQRKRDRGAA